MTGFSAWVQRTFVWFTQFRYIKFGMVGASGTVVNLAILYAAQEWIFRGISADKRLEVSLACAILIATINNFTWNRLWTWADRQRDNAAIIAPQTINYLQQFGQYAAASWLGIAMQFGLTLWLVDAFAWPYIFANVTAIVVASVSNYFANDWWTFRRKSRG